MRIVLGVDSRAPEANTPVVSLLQRMKLPQPELDIVHVTPPPVFPGGELVPIVTATTLPNYLQTEWQDAAKVVDHVAEQLGGAKTHVLAGLPASALLHHADTTDSDLIAVNGSHDSAWKTAFTGSVARALVVGAHQSVLLARPAPDRPLHAVFATDHSPYALRCAELLARFRPAGIAQLTILTAFPIERVKLTLAQQGDLSGASSDQLEHGLRERNSDVVALLDGAWGEDAPVLASRVVDQGVHEAIAQAMEETHADLLILGAHGHSFLERLTLGSISFREALTAPYSVLILRA